MENLNQYSDHELQAKQTDELNKLALVTHTLTTEMILFRKNHEKQMEKQTQSLQKIARAAEIWTALVIIGLIMSCFLLIFFYSTFGVGIVTFLDSLPK